MWRSRRRPDIGIVEKIGIDERLERDVVAKGRYAAYRIASRGAHIGGIRFVIGSNVAGQETARRPAGSNRPPHLLQLIAGMRNSMEREMIKAQIPLVDVMIRPELPSLSTFDFTQVELFTSKGERAARARLADIKELLGAPSL